MDIPPLDYASRPSAKPAIDRAFGIGLLYICVVLTLLAVSTAVRIEWLNYRAGGHLPRTDEGKWHVGLPRLTVQSWRREQTFLTNDPSLLDRPLTSAEQSELDAVLQREEANRDLRELVSTFGPRNTSSLPQRA